MNRTSCIFFSLAILVTLVGCASDTISSSITPTVFAAITNTPAPKIITTTEAAPAIQPTITPTPGANLSFLYLAQGSIQQYNLRNWSTEKLSVQSDGDILQAVLSSNQRWLAFQDRNGIKIVEQPFIGKPLSIPIAQSDRIRLLFSNNSELLAYSDGEGLKVFNVLEGAASLLLAHITDQSDVSKLRYYSPEQWSPDSEWIWLSVSHWEGVSHVLAHVPTKTFHEYTGCYSNMDWFNTSKAFVATVHYSGYLSCGDNDGIYLIELKNNNQVTEKRIYQETSPSEAWEREPRDIRLSPDSEKMSFVQLSYPDQTNQSSRLMLIDVQSNEQSELDSSQDDITSPIWSDDGKRLFYTIQGEEESQVIRLNLESDEKVVLYSLPNKTIIVSDLIDDEWLVASTITNTDWDSLYLVNTHNGTVVKISMLSDDSHIKPFLGALLPQ
jgi:hypothetical protein